MHNLTALLLAIYVSLVAMGLGRKLTSFLEGIEVPYRPYSDFALGIGILSHVVFLLGLLNLYRSGVAWACLLVLTIFLFKPILFSLKILKQSISDLKPSGHVQVWLWVGLLLFIIFSLFGAFVPPFGSDALVYHLQIPKLFIQAGRIFFIPSFLFNMPRGIEMIYLFGGLLHSETVGLLLNNMMAIATALAIAAFMVRRFSLTVGLLAALIFYSIPYGVWYATLTGKINLGLYLYASLAVFWFLEWLKERKESHLLLSGAFLGLAASTKYIGLYMVATLTILVFCFIFLSKAKLSYRLKYFFIFQGSFLLLGFPWYLYNAITLGNPIWPVFYPILGGAHYNMAAYVRYAYNAIQAIPSLDRNLWGWVTGPLVMNLRMEDFFSKGGIGPLFISFLPFSLISSESFRKHLPIYLIAAIYYSIWFCFSHDGMYLMPAVILLCLPLAETIYFFGRSDTPLVRWAVSANVILWLVISCGAFLERISYFMPVIIGKETKEEFLKNNTPFYGDLQWINANLPLKEPLFVAGIQTLYYLDRDFVLNGEGFVNYDQISTSEDLLSRLRDLHIHYALEVKQKNSGAKHKIWEECFEKYGQKIYYNRDPFIPGSLLLGTKIPFEVSVFKIKYLKGKPI